METISYYYKSKQKGLVFKIDFEKVFDKVNRSFLLTVLETRGFGSKWRTWIQKILITSKMALLINGKPSNWIRNRRGLKQGDPISPLPFVLVVVALTRVLKKAASNHLSIQIQREKY